MGIAALNVLMPVVVKTQNEAKTGALLGIYTGVVGLSGSIGALTSHPLAALTDFTQSAFLAWAAFGAVVLALWLAAFGRSSGPDVYKRQHKCNSQVKPGDFTSVLQNRLRTLYAQ